MQTAEWPFGKGEMARRIRSHHWASTPLGPIGQWPLSLRNAVTTVLDHPFPMVLAWGSELTALYNDAYLLLLDGKPDLLGRPLLEIWQEARDMVAPQISRALAGEACHLKNAAFMLRRKDALEEAFFEYTFSPMRDETGTIVGILNTAIETTAHVLANRERANAVRFLRTSEERQAFLLKLSDTLRAVSDPSRVQGTAMRMLSEQLGVSRAFYFRVERDEDGFVHVIDDEFRRDPNQPSMVGRHSLKNFGSKLFEGLARGEAVVISDIRNQPDLTAEQRHSYEAVGVRAFVNVPLLRDGEYSAGVTAHDTKPHSWSAEEMALLREAGERTWEAFERASSETELFESEERQIFLLKLSDALRSVMNADETQRIVATELGKYFGMEHASYAQIETEQGLEYYSVRSSYSAHEWPLMDGRYPLASFPGVTDEMRSGRTMVVPEVGSDSRLKAEDKASYAALNVATFVMAPLLRNGPLHATFAVHGSKPRAWTAIEVALLEDVAERTWAAVERARGEAALRESETRYRMLFDTIEEGFCLCERVPGEPIDFRYVAANPAFERQTGLSSVGKTIRQIVPGIEASIMEAYGRVAATGKPEAFTTYVAELGRWFEINAAATDLPGQIAVLFRNATECERTQAKLRESEARSRALVTAGTYSIYRMSPDWQIMYQLDSQTLANTSDPIENWVEKYIPEDDRAVVFSAIQWAIDNKSLFELEHRVLLADGTVGWVLSRAVPLLDAQGEITEWFGAGSVVTERLDAIEKLAQELEGTTRLQEISSLLIERDSGDALYDAILESAMAIMHAQFGSIHLLDSRSNELNLLASRNFHPNSARFWQRVSTDTKSIYGAALSRGKRVIVTDVRSADWIQGTEDLRHSLLSGILAGQSTPLITREGRVLGMLSTCWNEPHAPTESELRLLDILGRQMADFFERRDTLEVLRESENRFRLFVENVREYALVQTDLEGNITSWNPGAERLFGYTSGEIVGRSFRLLMPEPDRHDGIIAREMAILSRGERNRDAHAVQRKNGSQFWAEWVTEPVRDDAGRLRGTAKIMRDETGRQRSQQFLEKANSAYAQFWRGFRS